MHANRCLSWALTFLVFNSEFVAARPWHDTLNPLYSRLEPWIPSSLLKRSNVDLNPNGTTFLWLIDDVFQGKTFFDNFEFFKWADPTK
ncbi:glycoside hydrolase family 16 protein [Pleurotus ostreatus PC15]|uniref:Glycoside hydrolase family 16 protein n=1 Tax=Pleurotus ostreatus (strain PC15) TaxID=1137138 RepID=A0A067NRS9_PLEO1|nr:glycoside hydrolase family 16 protein [Pleurotus ostreatus PC15]